MLRFHALWISGMSLFAASPDAPVEPTVSVQPSAPKVWELVEICIQTGVRDGTGMPLRESTLGPFNPWADWRLLVRLTGPSGQTLEVPGFYAGDGQGGEEGDSWKVRFRVDEVGTWVAGFEFQYGPSLNAELPSVVGAPILPADGHVLAFVAQARDPEAPGFVKWGLLESVGAPYLKFRDGPYFLLGGTNSPENLFGFRGFDGPLGNKVYSAHQIHWNQGDPDWVGEGGGRRGRRLIGALNYLASKKVNSVYFLPMNLGGDGEDTFPFIIPTGGNVANRHYDISKAEQWHIVMNHATNLGIALNLVLAEEEQDNYTWLDDNGAADLGDFGTTRRLFYKNMIAMHGHNLALTWILCEENSPSGKNPPIAGFEYDNDQLSDMATFLSLTDPFRHPITVHTDLDDLCLYQELVEHPSWEPLTPPQWLAVTSHQVSQRYQGTPVNHISSFLEEARQVFATATPPRVAALHVDEVFSPDLTTSNATVYRKENIWDTYLNGAGLATYLGGGRDVSEEDFTRYDEAWDFLWYARKLLNDMPVETMHPRRDLILQDFNHPTFGDAECLTDLGECYVVYFPEATSDPGVLDLRGPDVRPRFEFWWYDPSTGQAAGPSPTAFDNPGLWQIPPPPGDPSEDWVLVVDARNLGTAQSGGGASSPCGE